MKRKALAITLAAVMAMGTCAVTASAADGDKYTIGICQLVQHDALDAATQGFKDEVIKELGEDAVTFDEQNAQGDSNTCSTIVNSFVSNNVDLILANATPALQAAAAGTSDIPILGTSVTEYGVALGLDDFDGTVGGNISGTADLAPLDEQAAMLQELFPDAKNVGLLSLNAGCKCTAGEYRTSVYQNCTQTTVCCLAPSLYAVTSLLSQKINQQCVRIDLRMAVYPVKPEINIHSSSLLLLPRLFLSVPLQEDFYILLILAYCLPSEHSRPHIRQILRLPALSASLSCF